MDYIFEIPKKSIFFKVTQDAGIVWPFTPTVIISRVELVGGLRSGMAYLTHKRRYTVPGALIVRLSNNSMDDIFKKEKARWWNTWN